MKTEHTATQENDKQQHVCWMAFTIFALNIAAGNLNALYLYAPGL